MKLNTTDTSATSGVAIAESSPGNGDYSRITVAKAGVYNIQFSAQLQRTASGSNKTVNIWLDRNGSAVATTNTQVLLSGASGVDSRIVAAWNFVLRLDAGDYVRLMWLTNDIHNEIAYVPTAGGMPAIPSLITTVTQVG